MNEEKTRYIFMKRQVRSRETLLPEEAPIVFISEDERLVSKTMEAVHRDLIADSRHERFSVSESLGGLFIVCVAVSPQYYLRYHISVMLTVHHCFQGTPKIVTLHRGILDNVEMIRSEHRGRSPFHDIPMEEWEGWEPLEMGENQCWGRGEYRIPHVMSGPVEFPTDENTTISPEVAQKSAEEWMAKYEGTLGKKQKRQRVPLPDPNLVTAPVYGPESPVPLKLAEALRSGVFKSDFARKKDLCPEKQTSNTTEDQPEEVEQLKWLQWEKEGCKKR